MGKIQREITHGISVLLVPMKDCHSFFFFPFSLFLFFKRGLSPFKRYSPTIFRIFQQTIVILNRQETNFITFQSDRPSIDRWFSKSVKFFKIISKQIDFPFFVIVFDTLKWNHITLERYVARQLMQLPKISGGENSVYHRTKLTISYREWCARLHRERNVTVFIRFNFPFALNMYVAVGVFEFRCIFRRFAIALHVSKNRYLPSKILFNFSWRIECDKLIFSVYVPSQQFNIIVFLDKIARYRFD